MQMSRHRVETLFTVFLQALQKARHLAPDEAYAKIVAALAPYGISPP